MEILLKKISDDTYGYMVKDDGAERLPAAFVEMACGYVMGDTLPSIGDEVEIEITGAKTKTLICCKCDIWRVTKVGTMTCSQCDGSGIVEATILGCPQCEIDELRRVK